MKASKLIIKTKNQSYNVIVGSNIIKNLSKILNDNSISFIGDNTFRGLIGTRMRILFVDAFIDYNIGVSNTINAGFGITF